MEETIPPPGDLPAHLAKKARKESPKASDVLAKEAKAAENRATLLNARVEAAKLESKKVTEAQALKTSFTETGMTVIDNGAPVQLPERLQQRLDSLPGPHTVAENLEKEKRAHAAHGAAIDAKIQQAKAHQKEVEAARERKQAFEETGMAVIDNGAPVELPKKLQERLNSLPSKPSAEATMEREARAAASREAQLAAKVEKAGEHHNVVQARMVEKKRKAEETPGEGDAMEA